MDTLQAISINAWDSKIQPETTAEATHALEHGKIVLLPQLAFNLTDAEKPLLTAQLTGPNRKNISFQPKTNKVRADAATPQHHAQLKILMRRYYQHALGLVINLFPHYQQQLRSGRTSLRTAEIAGRRSSYKKDDTRLHVDSFAATPVHGQRILRVFTNINPNGLARIWQTGESFETVAKRFVPQISSMSAFEQYLIKLFKITKTTRSHYDHFMLNIHDKMKKDMAYQQSVAKTTIEFLPHSTWIVFTDQVSHAALSGQHVLEQTFYLPATAMKYAETSPLQVLERLLARPLIEKERDSVVAM